jgi:nicotinate-nucleotide adenylyltransferase
MTEAPSRRIGLLGGTFDPVHSAHLALAQAALRALRLDQVRWIPAGQPWQKQRDVTAARHREAMVRLAIAAEPRFVLDRIELERDGPSYTLDTVKALAAAHPPTQWFLIIGADQYAGLHTWVDWRDLLGRVVLAVANRPGPMPAVQPEVLAFPHRAVPLPMLDISSTDVRQRVQAGADISALVPPEVARYIETHRLYGGVAPGDSTSFRS